MLLGSYFSISMNLNMFSVFLVPGAWFWLLFLAEEQIQFCWTNQGSSETS